MGKLLNFPDKLKVYHYTYMQGECYYKVVNTYVSNIVLSLNVTLMLICILDIFTTVLF